MSTELWLNATTAPSIGRLKVDEVWARPALGGAELLFRGDLRLDNPSFHDVPLWLALDVAINAGRGGPIGRAGVNGVEPLRLGTGVAHAPQFALQLSTRQLALLDEQLRPDNWGPLLEIKPRGYLHQDHTFVAVDGSSATLQIDQSTWVRLLENAGHRRIMLLELDVPDRNRSPHLDSALGYFVRAQQRFGDGEYRECVEHLRQCLAAIVGLSPGEEDAADTLAGQIRTAVRDKDRQGYPERVELVRRVLKFVCDLGAHPDTDQTNRADARAATHMTAALLQWYGERTPRSLP